MGENATGNAAASPASLGRGARRAVAAVAIAIGAASILYGTSVFLLGTGSTFFLFWFVLGAGLIVWGAGLLRGWYRRIRRGWKIAFAALLAAFCAVYGTAFAAVGTHSDDAPPAGVDYLVVLGAQVTETGPSAVLRLRLSAALDYLQDNPTTMCIVTGCQGPTEPWAEAYGMRDWLVMMGMDGSRIIVEDRARDTAENISYSRTFIPEGASVAIVSNNFHIFRALRIAEKQGLGNAYGLAAPMAPFYYLNNAAREAFAIIVYTLLGRM